MPRKISDAIIPMHVLHVFRSQRTTQLQKTRILWAVLDLARLLTAPEGGGRRRQAPGARQPREWTAAAAAAAVDSAIDTERSWHT